MNSVTKSNAVWNKPLSVVCDGACLTLLEQFFSENFPASSQTVSLLDALQRGTVADVVVVKPTEKTDFMPSLPELGPNVYLIAIVENLLHESIPKLFGLGVDEVITEAEIQSGRFDLMLRRRFSASDSNITYYGHHTIRQQSREELVRHVSLLHELLDSVPQLIFAKNTQLDYIYSNRAANEFYGLGGSGMHKMSMRDMNVSDDQFDSICAQETRLLTSHSEGIVYTLEKNNQNGEVRKLSAQKKPMSVFTEQTDTLTVIFTDTTDIDDVNRNLADERFALEMRNNFMSALSDVSMRLLERKSLDELMDHIAMQVVSLSNSESAFVAMLHESGQYLEVVGATGTFSDFKGFQHSKNQDVVGLAWELEELVLIEDKAYEDDCVELWRDLTKRCAVPFFVKGEFAGVVCVALDSVGASLENHLDILKLFTQSVSIAIENSLVINDQKDELVRHTEVGEITQSFYLASNLGELIDNVCNSLLKVFDSKQITVSRLDENKSFVVLAEWQKEGDITKRTSYSNVNMMSKSVSQWCVDNMQSAIILRGVNDERDSEAAFRIKNLLGIGCSITIPLIQDDIVWGVISVGKDINQRNYTEVESSLIELLISQLASSIMRQNLLDKIHFQAFHDSLTMLPNRLKFDSTLGDLVSKGVEDQEKFALMFLDLDGFKSVNDNQGHTIGDELLKSVAQRLTGCLHERDLLARMGGDEFAVLLRGVKSSESAHAIALRLSNAIAQTFVVGKYKLQIGVSIGVSFYPDNGDNVDDLLRNADFAMYEAKALGNGSVKSFNQSMAVQYRNRQALESDLLEAIKKEQFELHYQPKVNPFEGVVTGVEALIRWNHPEHGFISPADFIPLAEEAGHITEIGRWVLVEAIRQNAQWVEDGLCELSMAVNISAPQFVQDDFTSDVMQTLELYKLDPSQLELEVTESVVMNNISKVISTLNEMRSAGVSIAVDDFGTGYSSLAYLENLPLDCLKIDKIFVDKLITGDEENSLVNTILTLARSFGLHTVAEGVETTDQVSKLKALGCETLQGFYYSKPVPASQIPDVISSIKSQFITLRKAG